MRKNAKYVIGILLLLVSVTISAQIPQELLEKARAAGKSDKGRRCAGP